MRVFSLQNLVITWITHTVTWIAVWMIKKWKMKNEIWNIQYQCRSESLFDEMGMNVKALEQWKWKWIYQPISVHFNNHWSRFNGMLNRKFEAITNSQYVHAVDPYAGQNITSCIIWCIGATTFSTCAHTWMPIFKITTNKFTTSCK